MLLLRNKDQQCNNRSQVSQSASEGIGAYISELQAHHCTIPNQWTWHVTKPMNLLCSESVIPESKLSLQESKQLFRIKLLTSGVLESF